MDVKRKVELMYVMESYWTMLPPEIQDFILLLKRNQEWFDQEKKERIRDLCNEIDKYGELKRKWAIGHVKCIVKKDMCFNCYKYHLKIVGCYVDEEKIPRERFLGFDFKVALQRTNLVKSFC